MNYLAKYLVRLRHRLQPMSEVGVHEAKTHLSKLLKRVMMGEEITITSRGEPVARLVRVVPEGRMRKLGWDEGKFVVPDDFNDPLPPEVLADFYGE